MAIHVKGLIVNGLGKARSFTIPTQKPFFWGLVPNIWGYYDGTINVRLEKPLIIKNPTYTVNDVPWFKGGTENFEFLKVKLHFVLGGKGAGMSAMGPIDGLIYLAHDSVHYPDPRYHEILAPQIKNISSIKYVSLEIENCKEIDGNIVV